MTNKCEVLYFGCASPNRPGHHLFEPGMRERADRDLVYMLDTRLLRVHEVFDQEGMGVWFPLGPYLILTWWDRSADSRGASNSAIVIRSAEKIGWSDFVALAQEAFPQVFARQRKRIVDTRAPDYRFIDPVSDKE